MKKISSWIWLWITILVYYRYNLNRPKGRVTIVHLGRDHFDTNDETPFLSFQCLWTPMPAKEPSESGWRRAGLTLLTAPSRPCCSTTMPWEASGSLASLTSTPATMCVWLTRAVMASTSTVYIILAGYMVVRGSALQWKLRGTVHCTASSSVVSPPSWRRDICQLCAI